MIHVGDCLEVLRAMADASVDSIVTDPPYGLSFMGKRWDYDVPATDVWAECLRVLKPGGYLLAFAGTRTQHRMAVRIEDAGFEIRDMIAWLYGSGFPKSHNGEWGGTALKPALEPITVARKPLAGTVAENWRAHGTGVLNIDGCRVATDDVLTGSGGPPLKHRGENSRPFHETVEPRGVTQSPLGRWPANVIHDGSEDVLAAFPEAPGQMADASSDSSARKTQKVYASMRRGRGDEPSANTENAGAVGFKMRPGARRLDAGSASRFFYCAKASKADRDNGCEVFPLTDWTHGAPNNARGDQINTSTGQERNAQPSRNPHPTVKPTELMRYLCRLVTPAGGLVLDPFAGSGSTGKAAVLEGFRFTGIELNPAYAAIAEARIRAVQPGLPLGEVA